MRAALESAGERLELDCAHRWLSQVLAEGTSGQVVPDAGREPDVRVSVEPSSDAFDTTGWEVLTRGAWCQSGTVVVRDACSSGLDLLVTATDRRLDVRARWRPSPAARAASALLRARSRLLVRAVLLQYPLLWWSQQRGRSPLHASVCTVGVGAQFTALIAGPGGVGKSSLVNEELGRGGLATSDNVCVSDGVTTWGLLEPRRVPAGTAGREGRRMPHGRREAAWPRRALTLTPDVVLVLRRQEGTARATSASPCPPADAARSLVAGTYMAGELRRYWAFAATLAAGTGRGDPHPDVATAARRLTSTLPCIEVELGPGESPSLESLLACAKETVAGR